MQIGKINVVSFFVFFFCSNENNFLIIIIIILFSLSLVTCIVNRDRIDTLKVVVVRLIIIVSKLRSCSDKCSTDDDHEIDIHYAALFSLIKSISPINRLAFIGQVNSIKDISHLDSVSSHPAVTDSLLVHLIDWLLSFVHWTVEWTSIRCDLICHFDCFDSLHLCIELKWRMKASLWAWSHGIKSDVLQQDQMSLSRWTCD